MKTIFVVAFSCFALLLPCISLATVIDTSEYLIVDGEGITLTGNFYRSVSICVKANAAIYTPKDTYLNIRGLMLLLSRSHLNLIAPSIVIEGKLITDGTSLNTAGMGTAGAGSAGDGGAGYGGAGGNGGSSVALSIPGAGGPSYENPYLEETGSRAIEVGTDQQGMGGGYIRLDALSLTITATAQLLARGWNQTIKLIPAGTMGGGSGGEIYINSINTWIETSAYMGVRGGNGQGLSTGLGGGGGGGGGRILILKHPGPSVYQNAGTCNYTGGTRGYLAQNGYAGSYQVLTAPAAAIPSLQSPEQGALAGRSPTLVFSTTDRINSKFLKFKLQVSESNTFAPTYLTVTADQTISDENWSRPYFSSGDLASYTVPIVLDFDKFYYWRVAASNNNGATFTYWSGYRSFKTVNNTPPEIPLLLQPLQAAGNIGKTPVCQAVCSDPDGDSITCTLLLAKDEGMSNPQAFLATYPGWNQTAYWGGKYVGLTVTCQVLNTDEHPDALDPGTTYYWKVVVYDQFQESRESEIFHFTTIGRPSIPTLLWPVAQTIITTKNPTLELSSQSPTASQLRYKLELSSDNFKTIITFLSENGGGWTQNAYASEAIARLAITSDYTLVSGKSYDWRAAGYDVDNDNWSYTSDSSQFTIVTPPLLPELLSPEDHWVAPDARIRFQFRAASESGNTLCYRFELGGDADFHSILLAASQLADLSGWSYGASSSNSPVAYSLPDNFSLERGRDYFWRVMATDGVSWGPMSTARSFQLSKDLEVKQVRLFPNPAVSIASLTIYLQTSLDAQVVFRFYNKLGKEIGQMPASARGGTTGNEFHYDISHYAPGVYFCVIELKSGFGEKKITKRFAVVN